MFYSQLRKIKDEAERKRAVNSLIRLRSQLDSIVPPKDSEDNLLLATFNIRDFGKKNRRGWGNRLPESLFYIAEVISRFDFIAIQEVNELKEWQEVMKILGSSWDYIATDETDRALGGNGERMVFAYDKRKVWFQNIAGEIVLPPKMLISGVSLEKKGDTVIAGNQFKRTPFIASFQSGWFKFDICTVHIYYGASSGEKLDQRVEEIGKIAEYLSERADRALGVDRALILLGDFNINSPDHKTMTALTSNGFVIPESLKKNPTTKTGMHYDQIAFKEKSTVIEYIENSSDKNAGVVPLFDEVFSDNNFKEYKDIVSATTKGKKAKDDRELKKVYSEWRTYQFSDHYPMWVKIKTDGSKDYLDRMLEELS